MSYVLELITGPSHPQDGLDLDKVESGKMQCNVENGLISKLFVLDLSRL